MTVILVIAELAGMLIAGSTGEYFPFLNIAGVALMISGLYAAYKEGLLL